MMFASFHSNGTTHTFNDKLNTVASGILICSTVSISNFGGIPSTPGDLLKRYVIRYGIGPTSEFKPKVQQ